MAVAFRSAASNGLTVEAASLELVLTKPAGTVAGDVLVMSVGFNHTAGTAEAGTVTPPAGFTSIRKTTGQGAVRRQMQSFVKVAGSEEPATYAFVVAGAGAATKVEAAAGIAAFSGADPASPINVSGGVEVGPTVTAYPAPPVTTTVNGCLIISAATVLNAARTFTPAAETTEMWDLSTPTSTSASADRDNATVAAGATAGRTLTASATGSGAAQTIAVAPLPPAATGAPGQPLSRRNRVVNP